MTISNCSFAGSDLNCIRLANCNRCIISNSNFLNEAGGIANGLTITSDPDRNVKNVSSNNILVQHNLGGSGA